MRVPRSERDHPGGRQRVHTLMVVSSQVPQGGRGDDVLSIPYQTSEGLDTIIAQDIFPKAMMHVDS